MSIRVFFRLSITLVTQRSGCDEHHTHAHAMERTSVVILAILAAALGTNSTREPTRVLRDTGAQVEIGMYALALLLVFPVVLCCWGAYYYWTRLARGASLEAHTAVM